MYVGLVMDLLQGSYGVMAITLDFESNNPSSNLGRTSSFYTINWIISTKKFKIFRDMFNKVTNFLKFWPRRPSVYIHTYEYVLRHFACLKLSIWFEMHTFPCIPPTLMHLLDLENTQKSMILKFRNLCAYKILFQWVTFLVYNKTTSKTSRPSQIHLGVISVE